MKSWRVRNVVLFCFVDLQLACICIIMFKVMLTTFLAPFCFVFVNFFVCLVDERVHITDDNQSSARTYTCLVLIIRVIRCWHMIL